MIAAIKAEFRKLITIRSTYIYLASAVALVALFAGYGEGYRASVQSLHNPGLLNSEIVNAVSFVSVIAALVGLLLMAHEYRFNTIMYTLTASNSRTKVLLAKVVAVSVFSVLFTLAVGALSPIFTVIGAHLHGLQLVPQHIYYSDLIWRSLLYGWAYAMLALIIAALVRNLVGAIVVLLLFPAIVENILMLLLKDNAKYLPFHALGSILQPMPVALTPTRSAVVTGVYVVVLGLVAWILFVRRDAN